MQTEKKREDRREGGGRDRGDRRERKRGETEERGKGGGERRGEGGDEKEEGGRKGGGILTQKQHSHTTQAKWSKLGGCVQLGPRTKK